jgi:putative endonuclease
MSYFVYVIRGQGGKLYKGITNSIERRLYFHNNDMNGRTKGKGPFELVHHEEFATKQEAVVREKFLKSGQGREFLKAILSKIISSVGA